MVGHATDAIKDDIAVLAHAVDIGIEVALMVFIDGALAAVGANDGVI
jgi:hypothetical protein